MFEDLSVLLKLNFEKEKLILRLGNLGLQHFNDDKQAICELVLDNYTSSEGLYEELQELIGDVFEYEIYTNSDGNILEFWGDYGRVYSKIKFKSFKENYSEYTNEDLILKGKTVASLYADLYKKFIQNDVINTKIISKLTTQIKDEITRFQRKADFFEDKSEAFQQSIKVLQKLLNILEKPE